MPALHAYRRLQYLDFDLEIHPGRGRSYPVRISSPAGDLRFTMRFPFASPELKNHLLTIENALLRTSQSHRAAATSPTLGVQEFGQTLFEAALPLEVRGLYIQSLREAELAGKGLRLKLRLEPPELAALPWELLYDKSRASFVALSTATPIIRDIGLAQPVGPLAISGPLRILGMVAGPGALDELDIAIERRRVEEALGELRASGAVELRWIEGQTWQNLQGEIRREQFHVFHFIGHGGFDRKTDEGLIVLADEVGAPYCLPATDLAMLLADEESLRLVVLNSCEGARGGTQDVFSSTASVLIRRGVPAVLAMQFEITDRAAIAFARAFYEAVADSVPIDYAVAEARKAMRLAMPGTLEWATPVLYQRCADGMLFEVQPSSTSGGVGSKTTEPPTAQPRDPVAVAGRNDHRTKAEHLMRPGSFQEVLQRIRGMPHLAKQVGAVITTLSALAALALTSSQLWPDSAPPPTIGATFADVRLGERGVTMATVYRDYNLPTGGEEAWRLERPGIYIFYEIELVGLVGRSCTVRWTLLNGAGERVPGGQAWATVDAEAWPEFTWTAEAAEDRVTGRFWVPYAIPGTFHVEIALYDDRGTRLATYDTESFDARW